LLSAGILPDATANSAAILRSTKLPTIQALHPATIAAAGDIATNTKGVNNAKH
jgi:hypothetical protein